MIQIHHAGIKSPTSVTDRPVAPSPVEGNTACELTVEEIEEIRHCFVQAAQGQKAGFDGIELLGPRIPSQFSSSLTNRRPMRRRRQHA